MEGLVTLTVTIAILAALWCGSIWYAYDLGKLHGTAAGLREARMLFAGTIPADGDGEFDEQPARCRPSSLSSAIRQGD